MTENPTFLCVVVLRSSGEELHSETVSARSEFYARTTVADRFSKLQQHQPSLRKYGEDWYVDSVELE